MAQISATDLLATARASRSRALSISREAESRAGQVRKAGDVRDVVKLSEKALKVVSRAESALRGNTALSESRAKLFENLHERIMDRLEKLVDRAQRAGISIVVEEEPPAPEPVPAPSPAPARAQSSARENISAPAVAKSSATGAAAANGVPVERAPSAAAPAVENGRANASPAMGGRAQGGAASPGIQVVVADVLKGLGGATPGKASAAGNGADAVAERKGEARAAEVRAVQTDQAADAAAEKKVDKRALVIKAAMLKALTNFEGLSQFLDKVEQQLMDFGGQSLSPATVARETAGVVVAQAELEVAADDGVRALKAYKQVVDLLQENDRGLAETNDRQRRSGGFTI